MTSSIIIIIKSNDNFGKKNWKTFYCMKNDKGVYTPYDNKRHANLKNTANLKTFPKRILG